MSRILIIVVAVFAVSWLGFTETLETQERLSVTQKTFRTGDGSTQVATIDLNNDSNVDLVIANGRDGSVTVYLGDGKGQFKEVLGSPFPAGNNPIDIAVGERPLGIVAADLNGDGKSDLITANNSSDNITIIFAR